MTPTTDGVVSTILFDLTATPVIYGGVFGGSPADVTEGSTTIATGAVDAALPPDVEADNLFFIDFVDDLLAFDFVFSGSVFSAGGIWTLPAVGSHPFGSDPALDGFVGANVAQFSVLGDPVPFFGPDQELLGFLVTYSLDSITARETADVPEPATLGLVGTGLWMAVRRRRANRKREQAD